MADLQPLVEAIIPTHGGILLSPAPPIPSTHTVSDPSLQQALQRLASLLACLPSQLQQQQAEQAKKEGEAEARHELVSDCNISSTTHPECWSASQLDFILKITEAAILYYRRLPLENGMTKPVEGIYCSAITSCIKALKNLSVLFQQKKVLSLSDEQTFNRLIHILELVIDEGKALECKPSLRCWEDLFEGLDKTTLLQGFEACRTIDISFNKLSQSNRADYLTECKQDLEISEDIMLALSHEQPFRLGTSELENCPLEFSNMQSASQHYAVSGASIHKELLSACGCLLTSFDWELSEDRERQLHIRLSLISRTIRLLCSLSKCASRFPHPEDLLNGLANLAAFTPQLLMEDISLNLEETHHQRCCYAAFLSSVIALAEALGFGSCVTHNLRLYMAASALDVLAAARSRGGKGSSRQKLPAVLEPQLLSYIFGLIRTMHAHNWHNDVVTELQKFGHSSILTWDSKLSLRTQRFNLTAERTHSEAMNMLFPNDGAWLHDLLDALGKLYSIGIEASPAIEKLQATKKEEQVGSLAEAAAAPCEDEALFGNLFSESSKQLSSNDSTVQSNVENRSCMLHDSVLQTVVDVLTFLRDCVFCRGCHLSIFHTAQGYMNAKGIDLLLEIFFHSSNEKTDAQGSMDMMVQLSKASFGLMNSMLENGHMSCQLEQHFLSSLMEKGFVGCTMPNKTTALLGKVLIHHSSVQGCDKQHSSMTLAIWKSFYDRVASTIHESDWAHESIIDFAANLPSIFFLEVLLLAFHSSDAPSRLCILRSTRSLLKEFCKEKHNFEGPALSYCSLLFTRVIMILKYLSLHYKGFPRWLVSDLKLKVSNCAEEELPHSPALRSMFVTMAVTAGQSLGDVGPVGQQTALSDGFLALLYDINGFSRGNGQLIELFESSEEVSEVCENIRGFVDKWRGKSINQIEELLVERYTFFVGWTTVCVFAKHSKHGIPPGDLGGAGLHLWLTQSLSSYFNSKDSQGDTSDWWAYFKVSLSSFEAACVRTTPVKMLVDRLRQNAAIHVLLSILQRGIELFLADNSLNLQRDEVLVFCEQLVYTCVTSGSFEELSRTLVSLLSASVDCFHYDLLDILNDGQVSEPLCSSLQLVLKGGLCWTKQDQLLTKLGVSFSPLHALLRRGMPTSWYSEMLSKVTVFGNSGLEKLFLPSLLHGYPCSYHLGSATVISRMCLVECMLEMLRLLLKVSEVLGQDANLPGLLDVLMGIKLGEIFECVHPKCEEVLWVLVPSKEEQARLYDLYLVKQKEFMLKSLLGNSSVSEAVREELILHVVEVFNNIFLDPARNDTFRQYFTSGGGHLSLLMDLLDGCHQETVNVKVLQFLINVVGNEVMPEGGLKSELQEKLLSAENNSLCSWLEQRFFGFTNQLAEGGLVLSLSSNSVRETLIGFLSGLLSSESTPAAEDLRAHLLNALLLSLERAFNSLDNTGRRSYFALLLQMANREQHKRLVIKSVLELVGKLPDQNGSMEGLKSLLTFLCSLLNVCGGPRAQPLPKTSEGKPWPNAVARSLNLAPKGKHTVPKRSLEVTHAAMDRSGHSVDCDAVSVDEDEDDGTSDGEIISLEKEDDDEGTNSEKALASRVCTFTSSGNNFMEQHWYFCYTCDLTVSKGCCSVCAKVCHRGHKVVYSRLSRFFCDCGAGGVRGQTCLCLKPRKYVSPSSIVPSAEQEAPQSESDSDLDDEVWVDNERLCKMSVDEGEEKQLLTLFAELDVEGQVLSLCERLLSSFNDMKCYMPTMQDDIGFSDDRRLSFKGDFMHLRRFYKSGSYDMKIKAEYVNAKELKSHLVSGALLKSVLATNAKGKLAIGEGDKVTIFDVEQVIGSPSSAPVTVDKTTVKPLSKNSVRFELVHLVFNSINESYLAVAGYEDCQIFTINSRGEVTDRLAVELSLQDGYICRVVWVPGSQVQLMVVTSKFVKIYDLSQDNISPVHYFTILEDHIVDAALIPMCQGVFILVVLSHLGNVYRYFIGAGADPGACVLAETILIPEKYHPNKGVSLHYSAASRVLFLSYSEGLSLIGLLDVEGRSFSELSSLTESDQDGNAKAAGLHHWRELAEGGQGLFVALSSQRNNSVVAVSIGSADIQSQYLRATGNLGCPRVDGIAVHKSPLKDKNDLLILHDDGSLQVFTMSHGSDCSYGGDSSRSLVLEAEKVKKLGDAILNNKGSNSPAPVFPLDFFEKTSCITHEIRLGSDMLRNFDSEQAKLSLASDDGFLEGPSPSGFKITVYNSNTDVVMVGCRVHVGNSSTSHIPSELRIFQRTVKLEEGVRCWYDVPFTNAEALLADEEFTFTIGPTFGGFSLPRIDNLEVYGRPKDDFGWKEKLEAVLDMEIQASASGSTGSRSKLKLLKNAPIEEQVVADCLTLLCSYYVAVTTKSTLGLDGVSLESSRNRCRPLLELVFESDRQPLLKGAARRLLHALYPAKDAFYKAKDALRLTGVRRVCPLLVSKIGVGGSALPLLIQEFTSQMRAVCKIALHRRPNFSSFLENNGPSLIEDLMKVLLLIVDQQDAETVNVLVVPAVDLIYSYAECLALRSSNGFGDSECVAPAVTLLKSVLFAPQETVRAACSLAMSSRLLQVPFPKQTILANDEVGDHSRSTPLPIESGPVTMGSDGQVMMEEDGGNASVQYCCDGCSIVPIVGRRWHCNVCPDFDLCEACYEVMDGDRLPPPHSRDHPMSAIPIDIDNNVGGDVADIHFSSIEDLSDENLLQVAAALSMQSTSAPQSSLPDVPVSRDDSVSTVLESKCTAFSASKRAFNSLLLKSLIDESKGWMNETSGAQALPLMQFFYRLASANASPFIEGPGTESINLEMFVRLLIEDLNLVEPLSIKTRSNFGEVVVLVFTFFNLMLRNWHQPGSDQQVVSKSGTRGGEISQGMPSSSGTGSPASEEGPGGELGCQLDRACTALRQQQLMNYLLSIIQQLGQIFKSSSRSVEGPVSSTGAVCGALLTVRKEFAAGNFAPFFTDSYARAHRNDLFGEFHRLLLESTFRLAYNLVRPEKTSDRDQASCKADLKLDGWQEVLCSFINNPHTTSIRRFARRLLLHLCGSKGHYYNVRDAWQLSREVRKLFELVQKAGGFHGLIVYERNVKLVKCLSAIVEVAAARPRNWQKYCLKHPDILQFLLNGVFVFGEESVVQTLKLLTLAFYAGKESGVSSANKVKSVDGVNTTGGESGIKQSSQGADARKKKRGSSDDAVDGVAEKAFMDMEQAADQLAAEGGNVLLQFIDAFLLEWNAACVRAEAKAVLIGAWHHGRACVRELLLKKLLHKVPVLPSYGQNIGEFTELLTWVLGKGIQGSGLSSQESNVVQSCLTSETVKVFFDTLCSQNELLANHPNSRIYNTLSSLVDFDGYYLESEPCLACSCPEVPYSRMKLDSLKSETKFTDNRILVKCTGSHTIQSVTMNVHDARRSKSVKVLNLYYNNQPVTDLSELKNNWSLWKRAKSCHLAFNQTELKIEFSIPITACNFMIELDSFYENLQASSLESLQCPRCSRYVTDKHGICGNCHENAYQCRQCRNINYENLDSFLCNECGYSKYGRFEFNFMAKPSFNFESMENDEDMRKGLAAIESESENAHKRYQQLLGFKKPLLKLVSSIGETETDSQQKDSVQQMIVSLPGSSSFKINRKIAILGVLYGEKCKMAFDSLSRSVQTLQGLRRVLTSYLEQKRGSAELKVSLSRPNNCCYGCANIFVGHCLEWLQVLAKMRQCRQQLVSAGILPELFENNIHQGSKTARVQARSVLCAFTEADAAAVGELNNLIKQKALYCLDHHRSMDVATCVREELQLLSETCALVDEFWESRLRVVFQLLFTSIQIGARHPVIAEHIILPCLRIISQACTLPKADSSTPDPQNPSSGTRTEVRTGESENANSTLQRTSSPPAPAISLDKDSVQETRGQDVPLVSYGEWKNGAAYVDFVRREYIASQTARQATSKARRDPKRVEYLALKYLLRWKRRACKLSLRNELSVFEESSWVCELALSACSPAIRVEMCGLIEVLCSQSPSRRSKFLNLLMALLPATRTAGESACDYFELLYKMVEPEDARLFLTVRGFLQTLCNLIAEEVTRIEAQEHTFHVDISQGYILHKFIELLGKVLQVSNIRVRFMRDGLLSQVLEALLVVRGLVVQKTKLIGDCSRLLRDLLDGLLEESFENKRHFIRACIAGLQTHARNKRDRTVVYILELLCNIICPMKPEPAYMMVLNKAHTQEEFIRGSMTKNPYSSLEVGLLMRDVKNKICHQLDLLGLLEDDYGMELLVAGNIISLDLSVAQVYEQVWKKAQNQPTGSSGSAGGAASGSTPSRECPPMTVTYRLQGLDGEATEPMIKELEDDREETQDPEVEFSIAGVMRECNGLDVVLCMVQALTDEDLKSSQEELALVLKLLMYCCKIRDNRLALLGLGVLGVLTDTAKRAFALEATESAEHLLLIVECLVTEANESDIGIAKSSWSASKHPDTASNQAAHVVHMFLERLSHLGGAKKSSKQQRNNDMVARILPYLTYGEDAAMELLVKHFDPYLHDWSGFDQLLRRYQENRSDEKLSQQAMEHQLALENFCKVTESIKHDAQGERLKGLIIQKNITRDCIFYLKKAFAVFESGGDFKGSTEWAQSLELPSIPIILLILKGLASGHLATQKCLKEEGVLPLLHALEGVSGDSAIGARAENLMDTLADRDGKCGRFLSEEVTRLRHATRDEMRRRALQKREELLQELGMRREITSGGERIVISSSIEGLDDVKEEEAGLVCMVCREGYSLCPTDMLGTYCYSKRVNLGTGTSSSTRAEWVYTTVSHFNVIHFQCHLEAKRADASLKNPKKEWEGAALRNNETLCNNLFPLRGPSVPLAQYARCVDQYWDNLNSLGRADGSRLRLLTYDIVLMLARFATGASFSTDSKGGGKESNSRLLPFMLQMACHLLDQGGVSQRRLQSKALMAYLGAPSSQESSPSGLKSSTGSSPQRQGLADETVQFMMVQSLLLVSLDDWQQHRRLFLQRGVYHAYMQFKHGRTGSPLSSSVALPRPRSSTEIGSSTSTDSTSMEEDSQSGVVDKDQLFTVVQPMLIYTGLVDQLQRYLKSGGLRSKSVEPVQEENTKNEGGSAHRTPEPWELWMKERLWDIKAMLGFSKDLLEWLAEMQSAEDLQEAFDVMGALVDALSCHSSCEDFIIEAIGRDTVRLA